MDVINQKIKQFGVDTDKVPAYMERCVKVPAQKNITEAAKCEKDLMFFLKSN